MCGGKKWKKAEAPRKVSEPISLPFIQIWQLSVTGSHLFNSPTWVGHTFGHLREETEDHLNVVSRREAKSACLFVSSLQQRINGSYESGKHMFACDCTPALNAQVKLWMYDCICVWIICRLNASVTYKCVCVRVCTSYFGVSRVNKVAASDRWDELML